MIMMLQYYIMNVTYPKLRNFPNDIVIQLLFKKGFSLIINYFIDTNTYQLVQFQISKPADFWT